MKQINQLMALLAILAIPVSSFAQDIGQRLSISQGTTPLGVYGVNGTPQTGTSPTVISISNLTGLNFESLDAPIPTVGNTSCAGVTDGNCGWYKASWIFGDGNYKFFPDNNTTMDAASKTVNNYLYATEGLFGPVVYLTEKYHNRRPPEDARAAIQVGPGGASGTYQEITKRLNTSPNRRIDIDYNHEPRVDYPFNMVLSYRKEEPVSSVYYYYNSLFNNGTYNYTPTDLVAYLKTEITNYQNNLNVSVEGDDTAVRLKSVLQSIDLSSEGSLLDRLLPRFGSRIVYDVREIINSHPSGLTELRLFPVFQTLSMESLPDGFLAQTPVTNLPAFAAILVGPEALPTSDPAYQGLINTSNFLFDTTLTSLQLGPNDPRYIRGIQLLNLEMKASHDPNSLVVTKIDTIGPNQFNVTFKLTVCNEGLGIESSPSLTFKDLTGGHYGQKPTLLNMDASVNTSWNTGSATVPWAVNLDNFNISGLAPVTIAGEEHFVPSCREIIFSIRTDQTGVERLYQDAPRALEVCVSFSVGAGDCSENEPLLLINDDPIPVPPAPCGNGLLFYLLIGVIALVLWWYFLWRNAA